MIGGRGALVSNVYSGFAMNDGPVAARSPAMRATRSREVAAGGIDDGDVVLAAAGLHDDEIWSAKMPTMRSGPRIVPMRNDRVDHGLHELALDDGPDP
jgi:hypothetical protein